MSYRDEDQAAHVADEVRSENERMRHMQSAFMFAAWEVARWSKEHENRVPTVEELQRPPFNYTPDFAVFFLKRAKQLGHIREESEARGE